MVDKHYLFRDLVGHLCHLFQFPVHLKKHGPVTHLEFSPVKPYSFVATSSVTVNVHRNSTPYNEILSLKGFKESAYSGSFRHDGQLIVAGGEHADVQVFKDKIPLRKFTGHTGFVDVKLILKFRSYWFLSYSSHFLHEDCRKHLI